jgi:predicted Zn-dependent protease
VLGPVFTIALVLTSLALTGCETLTAIDHGLYQAVPVHPVTGEPVPNLIGEDQEVRQAGERQETILAVALRGSVEVDPAGPRLDQLQRVFGRLVAVSHRQQLPWQVHLIDDSMVNAFTTGGGYVYVFEGLFGDQGLVRGQDDDELAAVLAHEIAHVTLLHVSLRETWQALVKRAREDPFYGASFTTEQEAEADKLSVLYMALAGFDPRAGARIWSRAHQRSGSDPARFAFLHDHPLDAQRFAIVETAAQQVAPYYTPGQQKADWAAILADNPLFPRAQQRGYQPGEGLIRAGGAAGEAIGTHEQVKAEAEMRERGYRETPQAQAQLVRLLTTQAGRDASGRLVIQMQFTNGSPYNVAALGVTVIYVAGQQPLAQDPGCGGPASIPAGQTVWLACLAHSVPGATGYVVQVTGVQFGR